MTGSQKTLRDALQEIYAEQAQSIGDHPELEEMLNHKDGLLPPERAQQLNVHITHCDQCMADWEQLDNAPEGLEHEPLLTGPQRSQAWSQFEREVLKKHEPLPFRKPFAVLPWLAAAALLLLSLGLAYQVLNLKRQLADPLVNLAMVDLAPATLRGDQQPQAIPVPQGSSLLALRLNTADLTPFPHYLVRISGDHFSREISGLTPHPGGYYTLSLPFSQLENGTYQLVLLGQDGQDTRVVAQYQFSLNR